MSILRNTKDVPSREVLFDALRLLGEGRKIVVSWKDHEGLLHTCHASVLSITAGSADWWQGFLAIRNNRVEYMFNTANRQGTLLFPG